MPALLALSACAPLDVSVGAWQPDAGAGLPMADAALDTAAPDPSDSVAPARYLEAESARLSGDFLVRDDPGASGAQLLAAPVDVPPSADTAPGEARAVFDFDLERSGDYLIWGRIRSPDASHNRFWFSVDGGPWTKWRISVGDIWYWDDLHDDRDYGTALRFVLDAGPHQLVLAPAVSGVELDRLYISADGDHPPGNATPCSPPHSIEVEGTCLPSCGAQRGDICGEAACSGLPLIPAYDCAVCCREA